MHAILKWCGWLQYNITFLQNWPFKIQGRKKRSPINVYCTKKLGDWAAILFFDNIAEANVKIWTNAHFSNTSPSTKTKEEKKKEKKETWERNNNKKKEKENEKNKRS